jgi:hypothetical protein
MTSIRLKIEAAGPLAPSGTSGSALLAGTGARVRRSATTPVTYRMGRLAPAMVGTI